MKFLRSWFVWLAFASGGWAAAPWHHPLYLGNGGYWPHRVAVSIENGGDQPAAGEPVILKIPALAGDRVEAVRVCEVSGRELLFEVLDASGAPKRQGPLTAADQIVVPVECAAHASISLLVYSGNNQAWAVPDFLKFGLVNGSFEGGQERPSGWEPATTDELHKAVWDQTGGRGGSRCAQVEVAAGAEPTWVQWQQHSIPVQPGRTYQFEAWVKAENVVGSAGWFLHVNGDKPQLVNRTLGAGSGSFDWKQVSISFTAPEGAKTATVGTVLRGTGRGWFDDAQFRKTTSTAALRASVGSLEKLELNVVRAGKSLLGAEWPVRAVLRVINGGQARSNVLAVLDLHQALARLHGVPPNAQWRLVDAASGQTIDSWAKWNKLLVFPINVPANCAKEFHLYFNAKATRTDGADWRGYEQWLESPVNLAPNGSFEKGGDSPDGWTTSQPNAAKKIQAGFVSEARFGKRAVEFTIPPAMTNSWQGWVSPNIPVRGGASYLVCGFVQGRGGVEGVQLHGHFHDAANRMTKTGAFTSTGVVATRGGAWTNSLGILIAPPDAANFQLHLTMNRPGTVRHDGVLLSEALTAEFVGFENAATLAKDDGLRVWEVNPLVKVFPDDLPQANAARVGVECGCNEYEASQLVLRSGKALANAMVVVSALTNAGGKLLPPPKVERVGFVPIDHPSGYFQTEAPDWARRVPLQHGFTDGWAGEWPDPLIPNGSFALAAERCQPVWLTAFVPKGAAAGEYRGEISVRADGVKELKLPLTIKVLPFTLPERTSLRVIFDYRYASKWDAPGSSPKDTERKWLRFMAEHRLAVDRIDPSPRFTYEGGQVKMDAAEFDDAARFCFDELGMNVCYTPSFFYAFGWAYTPKKIFGLEPFSPEYNEAFKQAYKLFSDHIKAKGWHDRFVYYISDEPHFTHPHVVEQMQKLCALAHSVDPAIPIYSSTWRYCAAWDQALDLWGVGQHGSFPLEQIERLRKTGTQFWFTCDGQMATDTPYLATERLLPYYCFKYGMRGFEFWGLSWWTYNPWERGWHTFIRQSDDGKKQYWIRYPNGDGFLTYPGKFVGVDGPVSTIRLEQVRQGLEDYEAIGLLQTKLEAARAKGVSVTRAEQALAAARELVSMPNPGGYRSTDILPNPEWLPAVRHAINEALVELLGEP